MGIFEQKRPEYANADTVWIMHDVRLATGILSEEKRQFFEMKVLEILARDPSKWAEVRNALFWAKDQVVEGYKPNINHLVWADKTNKNYHKLLALREMLLANPVTTLQALDESITDTLGRFWVNSVDVETIGEMVESTSEENFSEKCVNVEKQLGHTWIIFFLEWCITWGKVIQKCIQKAKEWVDKNSSNKKSFEYWNYRNVLRLWETRLKIVPENNNGNEKSFTLSGWSWNTIAWLWVIKAHLDTGWTISTISWTSMWSTIWAFVGMIGNDTDKLWEFMNDVQNGFNYEWTYWTLPGNAYNWKKMVAFLTILWRKWWINENTRFSDLKIPVLVNAWRQYRNWEQEVLLWWDDKILPALLASMNRPLPLLSNTWLLWIHKIDDIALIDYAANERWNPTHWVQSLWVKDRDIYVVDAGYSSETWTENYWTDTRARFPRATERDFDAKLRIRSQDWPVINIDPQPSKNSWWTKLSPEIIGKLYQIWQRQYTSTVQSPL